MTRLCLDTSAYSQFRRGHQGAVRAIDSASRVLVPATTLGELELGFAGGANRQANQHALALFLADSSVEIVPIDHEIARTYGRIMHTLRRAGTPVPTNDAWIAACAETTSSVVLTFDRHFSLIASVRSLVLARDAGT